MACFNETKHRLMSAKTNLLDFSELKNTGLFYKTYFSENNFSSSNLPSLLLYCPMDNSYFVIARINNLYNFVMNSTVW